MSFKKKKLILFSTIGSDSRVSFNKILTLVSPKAISLEFQNTTRCIDNFPPFLRIEILIDYETKPTHLKFLRRLKKIVIERDKNEAKYSYPFTRYIPRAPILVYELPKSVKRSDKRGKRERFVYMNRFRGILISRLFSRKMRASRLLYAFKRSNNCYRNCCYVHII